MADFEDKTRLRVLAKRLHEIAQYPIMEARKRLWEKHNSLQKVRPLVLVFPKGAWREIITKSELKYQSEKARVIEEELLKKIYTYENLYDDTVVEDRWIVGKVITDIGWGLEPKYIKSGDDTGAWRIEPIINEYNDLKN